MWKLILYFLIIREVDHIISVLAAIFLRRR